MADPVVLDAGPLVAFINRGDQYHEWACRCVRDLDCELITCEAVVSETFFLVQSNSVGVATLLSYLDEGIVRLDFDLGAHLSSVTMLMRKYADVPMSLADACLVRMSELHDRARVFTCDSDFKRYRRHGRQTIPLIFPAAA
jgi:predicted nucleic acid-binding protein